MESKTKSGFTVIQVVEIPVSYLRKGVLKELSGRELYRDTDDEIDEAIYDGSVFEAIACEQSEMKDSPIRMKPEDLAQVEELAEYLGEYELIRVNKI
jgi:hypothetical protein